MELKADGNSMNLRMCMIDLADLLADSCFKGVKIRNKD